MFDENYLEKALASLGYPGFAYLVPYFNDQGAFDPTELIQWAVIQDVLDVRLIEAIPWLIAAYAAKIDWGKLINNVREHGAQNRLGYLVCLALDLAESKQSLSHPETRQLLKGSLLQLQEIRQSQEQTLMEEWCGPALRAWMRVNRSREASEWHLLSTLTTNHVQHAE